MRKEIICLIVCAIPCALLAQNTGVECGHIWIDMGLPSGIKWASTNIGANLPQDEGNYYAWGETTPKDTYYKKNYKYHDGTEYTKYTEDDGLLELEAMDDAATANLGEDWRMPTYDEIEELQNNCTWTWTEKDG